MRNTLFIAVAALAAALLVAAPAALAGNDRDREVIRTGNCSAGSNWKLKAKNEDGRIEVEFEVDQNRNGVRWHVVLRRNGTPFFTGSRVTRPPSGSFELRRVTTDGPGTDVITARATSPSGQVCRATARF